MSKTVHPYSHRLVILRDWQSKWFADHAAFPDLLKTDVTIREFLVKKLRGSYVSDIQIEREKRAIKIALYTSRPGMIIGKNAEGIVKIKKELASLALKKKLTIPEEVKIEVYEVENADGDAALVAYSIAEAMEKRMPYRRVLKQTVERVMMVRGVQGVRIVLGGRLGGAEIARGEELKRGNIPLQTLRADISFAREKAHMTYGVIGIKVWIYKGLVFADKK
jgi:small subunit ribosomal protein S3